MAVVKKNTLKASSGQPRQKGGQKRAKPGQSTNRTAQPKKAVRARTIREGNRKRALMDAAASMFATQGYAATTMRDIAAAVDMLPGSIYYHFPSKEHLLLAIYREAVEGISARVEAAVAATDDPWNRLEAAATAHLETILDESAYAKVMVQVVPEHAREISTELALARDNYEARFRDLISQLGLPDGVSGSIFRLMMLGALNWAQIWYRPGGITPAEIARNFMQVLRDGVVR